MAQYLISLVVTMMFVRGHLNQQKVGKLAKPKVSWTPQAIFAMQVLFAVLVRHL